MIEYLPDLKALAASIEKRNLGMLKAFPEVTDEVARARAESYMAGVHDALHALQAPLTGCSTSCRATPRA